jgi:hypothetical protein
MTTNKNIKITWGGGGCTNSGGGHVAMVTKLCSVAPIACGFLVWNLRWLVDFFFGGGEGDLCTP